MIYYITGGTRSGKSRYAQQLALSLSDNPVYLATARKWDEDFEQRIRRHQQDRDERWQNIEEERYPSKLDLQGRIVVLDCVTLWLTNFFSDTKYNVDETLKQIKTEFDKLAGIEATWIIISNEIGMGMHADTETGRKFADLQGWINQHIAQRADKAIFMVSGLPLNLRG
ncbi:bifunctional adenosylcobinamide kinase/adenosylcobinamide-phosphate guanylyltransferase [Mucilaginibacter sp. BT774]|uniref:bifunctional adenosylcobinamide kinase/adenosylcobinamide-phosphate guanylyltransferase n=1 Tax=Mucilaginibacter sp. BT774 TaxID=3062276 RepID=UPI002675C6C2|nr:bifunctional adenosylcobinamide kinase/adenosylcobinamide-phosphate guanylyltransferase [Mucilaginibacter sp. BT774]MDO3625347.1 bifunctional adenosylcobinamide kinase/adenosylcobinamide-phosphate guanylyltransferase [Mucilaginibacter sp. BT774]